MPMALGHYLKQHAAEATVATTFHCLHGSQPLGRRWSSNIQEMTGLEQPHANAVYGIASKIADVCMDTRIGHHRNAWNDWQKYSRDVLSSCQDNHTDIEEETCHQHGQLAPVLLGEPSRWQGGKHAGHKQAGCKPLQRLAVKGAVRVLDEVAFWIGILRMRSAVVGVLFLVCARTGWQQANQYH